MKNEISPTSWPDRFIFTQWRRGDVPERYRNCAVIGQRYKLVDGKELYDMVADAGEKNDIASEHPQVVELMRRDYDKWFDDVSNTRPDNYAPPKIYLGTPYEEPVILSRQDWRVHGEDGWGDDNYGHWEILVTESGTYSMRVRLPEADKEAVAYFRFNTLEKRQSVHPGTGWSIFENVELTKGPGTVESWLEVEGNRKAARYIYISRKH
jgi:hypothetical protein